MTCRILSRMPCRILHPPLPRGLWGFEKYRKVCNGKVRGDWTAMVDGGLRIRDTEGVWGFELVLSGIVDFVV